MNRNTLFIVGGVLLIAGVYFYTQKPSTAAENQVDLSMAGDSGW